LIPPWEKTDRLKKIIKNDDSNTTIKVVVIRFSISLEKLIAPTRQKKEKRDRETQKFISQY